jgi:hypothetical protein
MRRSLSRLAALARRALFLGGNRPARSKPRRRVLRSLSMQGLESRSMFAVASPTDWGNDKLVNPTNSGRITRSFSDRFESNNTVATATNLGTRVGNSMVGSLAIGPASTPDRDVFRFSTTQTGTSANYIDILFTHASGDLDARLLDSAGNQLATSEGTSNNERLSMSNRAAGTYFVEVYGHRSAVNNYDLDLRLPGMTADRFEANDTRQTATDLRTLSGASTVSDLSINTTTDRDFYRITTTGVGTSAHYVDVLFNHAAGDIDARLLDASGNTLANSTGTVNNERLSLSGRAPGTYFVAVFGYSGAVNRYSLDFRAPAGIAPDVYESNDTRATSSDLRTVAGQLNLSNLSIHSSSDRDFYRLATTMTGTAAHYIDVNFTHAQGDIDARLLNAAGEVLATSVTTSDRERLSLQGQPAGTYFLEVYGYSGAVNRYGMEFNTPGGLVVTQVCQSHVVHR